MRVPNIGVLAPALLLIVALLDWSLVSLLFLAAFLVVQYNTPRQRGQNSRREDTLWISIMFLATTAIIAESGFYIAWLVNKEEWSTPRLWWAKFIGFARLNPWKETFFIYPLLATQLSVAFVAAVALHSNESDQAPSQESFCRKILSSILYYGSCLRINFNLLLPAAQLLVGVSHPSWVSLPFFICSCVGLLRWSLTSNHFGLFWWRPLLSYTAVDILLLYVYQLPVDFPSPVSMAADYIGLYKASKDMGWPEIIGGVSLLMYYIMLCSATNDLEEMELGRFPFTSTSAPRVRNGYIASSSNSNMTEQLLPSQLPISNINSRSVLTWKQVLMKGVVFQHIIVNFFTYGFPVFLLSIALWSFYYISFCAFGLLMYTGYVLYAFPSKFYLRRLNAFLLGFILLWAVSTYMFNAAFTFSRKELEKDTEIWDTVGLWHYSTPGLFIFVQFSLGVLVAVDIFVSDSIFSSLKDEDSISCENQDSREEQQDRKTLVLVIATWCLRRSSRAISLFLIFILGMKPGLIHAIYMVFFLIYLLRSTVGRQTRQFLILLCEVHFALLYLIQLDLIYEVLEHNGQTMKLVLSQLGVSNHASPWEFLSIALLLCFSTIQNHGLEVLLSLDAILQRAPLPPLGFSIMKPQLSKWVLLTVCSSQNFKYNQQDNVSHVNWIAKYLSSIGKRFQTAYHSHGTYIAYLTILVTVYLVNPNYISFGYMFFLLLWVVGRQLVDKTRKRLWLPLMIYAMLVFIFTYILSSFPSLQMWLATKISVYPNLGFKTGASVLENIWESLAILVVMQLYRYERMQNPVQLSSEAVENFIQSDNGFFGFLRRFLIWHSGKILSVAVFYASIAPVSIFGFLYLITLVFATHLAKTSRFPAKLYSSYTGLLVTSEYLFQMWGNQAQMFPGQKHATIATWLGFQVFEKGFWGIESGLRSKALVIVACILQYNAFRWLKQLPNSLANTQMWEEPCHLFNSCQYSRHNDSQTPQEIQPLMEEPKQFYQESGFMDGDSGSIPSTKRKSTSQSLPYRSCSLFSTDTAAGSRALNVDDGLSDHTSGRYSFYSFWGSTKESHRWNKNLLLSLKKERYEAQLRTLKLYLKFWAENFFNLFGLEINMLTLLLVSFTVLNAISLFYVLVVGLCILLNRRMLHMLWPVCVFLFSCILLLEYVALGKGFPPWNQNEISKVHCHDCWKSSKIHFEYCTNCWLGVVADDRQMIVGYFVVFFIASFKLRADFSAGYLESHSYRQLCSLRIDRLVWKEISFETKGQWTWLDHLRLFLYRHFMNVVFILVLITGTLEYDILHLGYLGFALIFFRMRFTIMKKRNKVFRFLRLYNFILIVLSLAYQAPFFGDIERIKCSMPDCLYGVIGLYKYDYGFRITSRSALVDIIIFCLVGLQSYIFRSREFDQVLNYLEAEQIDAMLHAQEKRAAWKTAQLQHIREIEDRKQQRHLQVEKMKAEMSHLQNRVDELHSTGNYSATLLAQEISDRERKNPRFDCFSPKSQKTSQLEDVPTDQNPVRLLQCIDSPCCYGSNDRNLDIARIRRNSQLPLVSCRTRFSPIWTGKSKGLNANHPKCVTDSSAFEITELEESAMNSNLRSESLKGLDIGKAKEPEPNPLASAVQLIGDGVAHVHSLGNQAVANIVSFFNIGHNESDSHELSSPDTGQYDMQDNGKGNGDSASGHLEQTFLIQPGGERVVCDGTSQYFRKLCQYCWSKMRSNVDLICYCCFVLVFLWNFSLLNMVYLAALFLYALFVNPGPNHIFWLAMLIYTELNILIQYIYQINTHHCGPKIDSHLQWEIGFPARNITSSFVTSVFPLFVVYFSTLVQCSIKARDGEWMSVSESGSLGKRMPYREDNITMHWKKKLSILALSILNSFKITARTLKRYWETLTHGSEAPPHFVQVSMNVNTWPEDGIQPERIESALNTLLLAAHKKCCKEKSLFAGHSVSRVRVESIESSPEDASIALAVFEVIYASPVMGCPASALYSTLTPAADVATELQKGKEEGLVEETGFPYPIISVIAGGKREVDLYAYIFFADLVTFFLVAIFYQSVIKHNNQFLDVYQLEDQFPKEFVFVLMILFFLIVLDRIIYLSSFALGKVIYYFFSLVLFTYSVTEYAWNIESRGQQTGGLALRAIYLTKAVSLALQALQIKFGLPQKSTLYGQFLTSRVTNLNYLGFHLYRALPFLYELRCVLDWSCTATSLTMYDWLKLEDIYASLFLVKCDINLSRTKHQLGQKQSKATKFCSGICLFLILICVIWAPMLIYSSGNPTNIANPVKDVSTQIDIKTGGGRLTLYETTLCECHLWEDLLAAGYNLDPNLRTYDVKDIQLICCQADANTLWAVPPSALKSFMKSIDEETFIISTWEFTRDRPKGKEAVKYNLINPDHSSASGLVEVLNGTSDVVKMFGLYPRYFRVTGSGEVHMLEQVSEMVSGDLIMNRGASSWWSFYPNNISDLEGCGSLAGPIAIVVSEETPQGFIGDTLSKFSIWSLYITFVLAVGRFIRLQCSDLRMRIPYENFPSCDRLIAICEDIYAARAEGELKLEELLFGTLTNIYRSPHVLMEYTKRD